MAGRVLKHFDSWFLGVASITLNKASATLMLNIMGPRPLQGQIMPYKAIVIQGPGLSFDPRNFLHRHPDKLWPTCRRQPHPFLTIFEEAAVWQLWRQSKLWIIGALNSNMCNDFNIMKM